MCCSYILCVFFSSFEYDLCSREMLDFDHRLQKFNALEVNNIR